MKHFLIIGCVVLVKAGYGQNTSWANTYVSGKYIHVNNVHADLDGNILQCGQWKGKADLNPEIGVDVRESKGSGDMFLQKTDAQGHVLWTKIFVSSGNILNQGIATDGENNIIICGAYKGDISPNPARPMDILNGYLSVETGYAIKLTKDGNYVWAKKIQSTGMSAIKSVAIGKNNDVVLAGYYGIQCTFSDLNKQLVSKGGADALVWKLNTMGQGVWAKSMGGTKDDYANNVSQKYDNWVVSGTFMGEMIINEAQPDTLFGSGAFSSFMVEIINEMANNWALVIKSTSFTDIHHVDVNSQGNICATILINGTVKINNDSINLRTPSLVVIVADTAGQIQHHKVYTTTQKFGYAYARWKNDGMTIAIGAMYRGSGQLDGLVAGSLLKAADNGYNILLCEVSKDLSYINHFCIGSIGDDFINDFAVDAKGNMYMSGSYEYDIDFNLGGKALIGKYKLEDNEAFVFKRQSCAAKEGVQNIKACNKYTWINGHTYTSSATGTYVVPGFGGCDSMVTLNLEIENIPMNTSRVGDSLLASSGAFQYQWLDCNNSYLPITAEINRVFRPQVKGKYAVEINNGQCLDTSDCINYWSLSVAKEQIMSINVAPNPNTGHFKIILPQQNILLSLYDIKGRVVWCKGTNFNNEMVIDLKLESGLYLLKAMSQQGKVANAKIVIE